MQFHKISAKNKFYIEIKDRLDSDLILYKEYEALRNPKKDSGKAASYYGYLIRLVVFAENFYGYKIPSVYDESFLFFLNTIKETAEFKLYNKNENNFPSSTLNSFLKFSGYMVKFQTNKILDMDELELNNLIDINSKTEISAYNPESYSITTAIGRKILEGIKAKNHANWKCEVNPNHISFKSNVNSKMYIEAHHIIPISRQSEFNEDIDIAQNLICLCPNCHRFIHYGNYEDKKELVEIVVNSRKDTLLSKNIELKEEMIKEYYFY